MDSSRYAGGIRTLLLVCALIGVTTHARAASLAGLATVDNKTWDATAVRKVMRTFAFGGHASDAQITKWANLSPAIAIEEMLNFDQHNLRLSPVSGLKNDDDLTGVPNRLRNLSNFWASANAANKMDPDSRESFQRSEWSGAYLTWLMAARARGLNPFRHRIGLWETNYHLAFNQDRGISNWQAVKFYDDVMAALQTRVPYQDVIKVGALSAALAQQYGHRYNAFYDGVCYCNEDFAREFHQLGFGILGVAEPDYHEHTTIKNTAKALTGIEAVAIEAPNEWEAETLRFTRTGHPQGDVEILHRQIPGRTMAEKIGELVKRDINHSESRANLPIMIIQNLADDDISATDRAALRKAWDSMKTKDLLTFIRAYAISTRFHSPNRIKRWTSIDRFLLIANLYTHSNLEQYYDVPRQGHLFWDEEIIPFRPTHDVFGHQSGVEAAGSAEIFRKHFETATSEGWRFLDVDQDFNGHAFHKNWRINLPADAGKYRVARTARWLWDRFISDGGKNFGRLERAHLYALLARGQDLSRVAYPAEPGRIVTLAELTSDPTLTALVETLKTERLSLDSTSSDMRSRANRRIGAAINFIIATPFMLADEGR